MNTNTMRETFKSIESSKPELRRNLKGLDFVEMRIKMKKNNLISNLAWWLTWFYFICNAFTCVWWWYLHLAYNFSYLKPQNKKSWWIMWFTFSSFSVYKRKSNRIVEETIETVLCAGEKVRLAKFTKYFELTSQS